MPLPVRACSDEELEGYAQIEPAAAAELARRIAEGSAERDALLQEAQEEAGSLARECNDMRDQRSAARRDVSKCCLRLRNLVSQSGMSVEMADKFNDAIGALEESV